METKDAENNSIAINKNVLGAAVLIAVAVMAPQFYMLTSAVGWAAKESARLQEVQKISPSHDKYISELRSCWERPAGSESACAEQMISKYELSSDMAIVREVLSDAGIVKGK